ncbi:hypothetical protein HYG77_04645 [Rhodococcus sp. ZPP]|uniref:hypothetical protein n=1 Tax=Rhodococcus sp. ZPP TaxID=2749906 RepID=UPI001AD863E0|nr:hypothetical protein [Rhodococcus sp. ZPP]QTJ64954.1 hypothetical protein HYG77_04645 [Rhodococcus sp. ZPP]
MSVLQLVVTQPEDEFAGLAVLPNPKQAAPEAFSSKSGHALLLGSNDLVEVAAKLAALGFQTISVDLVDRHFSPIEEDRSEQLAAPLLVAMDAGDVELARNFHESKMMAGVYVSRVRLRSPGGGVIALAQDGVLTADDSTAADVKKGLAEAMHMRLVE